jgi:diamine N-acetyltransferase
METERLPGFAKMVGRWTSDRHKAAYSKPSYAYLIGTEIGGDAFGFAIVRDLDDPHGNVCLKRIAIASPGRGYGTPFLGMVLDWVFREATAYRVWLDVLADNDRAARIHEGRFY